MSFTKITAGDVSSHGVQSKPNKLTGTAAQNKQAFDELVSAVVKEKFNALIDELTAATAAGQLGVDTIGVGYEDYDNLQDVLEALAANVTAAAIGEISANIIYTDAIQNKAVTTAKIDDAAVTEDKLDTTTLDHETVNLNANQVRPIYVTNDFDPDDPPANDGIYLVYE